jgi:putative polyketide hydroxylase
MSKDRITTVPVLIVGAGPAGLATAITLGRNGVEVVLVERRNELSGLPRATVVSTRSMELMRQWGLEDRVRQGGMDVEWLELECATLAEAARGSLHAVGLPTTEQSALVSPAGAACVPQDHLEPVLLEHLKRLPGAQVRLGSEVVGLEQAGERTRTELRDVATGKTWSVESQYLIAADGAHSVVRNALGIPMRGPDRLLEAVSTVFRAPLWDVLGDRRFGLYWVTHPEATGIFLPRGTRRPLGVRRALGAGNPPGIGLHRGAACRADPDRVGHRGSRAADRALPDVPVRGADRRHLPPGTRVPGGRRGAPGHPEGRHGHERGAA